ncbi:MAG: endolytic transglycosylase MltG [Thermoleophilia bacterium]
MRRVEITSRKKASNRNNNILMLVGLVAAALLVLALLALVGGGGDDGAEVTITVPEGATTADIAAMLLEADVIDNDRSFLEQAQAAGIDQLLQAGVYVFTRGEPLDSIFRKLKEGHRDPAALLAVPEGYSIYDIADLVEQKTGTSREEYLQAIAVDGRVLPLAGAEAAPDLEGFLFPSTYNLEPDFDVSALVDKQLATFVDETHGLQWDRAAGLGVTEYEALIIASMVEREAKVEEERPLVAAVIYNRINLGMKLEIDATVQYALGYWKEDLTVDDLAVDSRFNTRLYGGLPPGPICNPGVKSIEAALNPAAVDYLYYVATGDDEGHHLFTASFEEFLAAGN